MLAVVVLAAACSQASRGDGDEEAADGTGAEVLVGEVDGGRALIALVRDDNGVTVYTCGFDENLATHTGWFFGGATLQGTIPVLASAGGLLVEGTLGDGEASGTLTLKSGEAVAWSAVTAEAGAGLYKAEDIVALTGLVVHNDGRMAGNARLNPTGTPVVGTLTPPVLSVPVAVPGGVPLVPAPVTTTFPVGTGVATVPVIPVLAPKTIVKTGPKLVFLVHGMSDSLTTTATAEDIRTCDGPKDRPFYSRCEWGVDFIPGLFGTSTARGSLFNLAGRDVSGELYLAEPPNRPLIDERLGITARDSRGCVTNPVGPEVPDNNVAQHFVTVGRPTPRVAPKMAVFTTWRDSTRGVVESGVRITNQVYAAVKWYEREYPTESPALYFIGQSFGGLATRFLLSNPPRETFDTELLNADRITVCPEDRTKMDYLRDRTVLATTLATPHEGSFLAELGQPPKDYLRSTIVGATTPLADVMRGIDDALPAPNGPNWAGVFEAEINDLLKLLDTPALRDMKLATMVAFNRGPLSPERARRSASSPMVGAQGALVPIYVTLGRSPGSTSFDSPDILNFDTYNSQTEKEKGWIISTMVVDIVIRQFVANGYGRVDVAPYAPFANLLDRRARIFDLATSLTGAKNAVAAASADIVNSLPPYFVGAFGPGVDGILAYLGSSNVRVFPNVLMPVYVDRVWKLGLSGSQQVPMLQLSCANTQVVIDYDPLVRALLLAFGTTEAAVGAIASLDLLALLDTLLRLLPDLVDLAVGTQDWLAGKVAQIANAPDNCKGLVNIPKWTLSATTGAVPAPAWERTTTAIHDREMDADGPVHSASALGFTLGRVPFFFEHDRLDGPVINGKATAGSWYRLIDNPGTEQYNHGLQYQNDVGRLTAMRLLDLLVGPVPRTDGDSFWP